MRPFEPVYFCVEAVNIDKRSNAFEIARTDLLLFVLTGDLALYRRNEQKTNVIC